MSNSAHASSLVINNLMAENRIKISFREKQKIVSFLDKLSGPPIAVYCLDLFPLNNREFYIFIGAIFSNYFLFIKLITSKFFLFDWVNEKKFLD
jgi:hypothetical protein